jgi:hypothetical protein
MTPAWNGLTSYAITISSRDVLDLSAGSVPAWVRSICLQWVKEFDVLEMAGIETAMAEGRTPGEEPRGPAPEARAVSAPRVQRVRRRKGSRQKPLSKASDAARGSHQPLVLE